MEDFKSPVISFKDLKLLINYYFDLEDNEINNLNNLKDLQELRLWFELRPSPIKKNIVYSRVLGAEIKRMLRTGVLRTSFNLEFDQNSSGLTLTGILMKNPAIARLGNLTPEFSKSSLVDRLMKNTRNFCLDVNQSILNNS